MIDLTGQFLVASPHLPDLNFGRSVVYLIRHDSQGAFGLILNRPTGRRINDLFEELLGHPTDRKDVFYCGGPVEGPVTALHTDVDLADVQCPQGVCVSTDQKALEQLARVSEARARFFIGYSGWGPDQLEQEIQVGGWLTTTPEVGELFGPPDQLWQHAVNRVGREILSPIAPKTGERFDPLSN